MCTRILFAYDGTEPARKAFDYILKLAPAQRTALTILAVLKPSLLTLDQATEKILEVAVDRLSGDMAQLQRRAAFAGTPSTLVFRVGRPVDEIVRMAARWDADVIVTGCRPLPPLAAWLKTSVSNQVRARATCPVVVVR